MKRLLQNRYFKKKPDGGNCSRIVLLIFSFLIYSFQGYAQANNNCTGAISLTSSTSCSNTSGTINGATASTGFPAGCAAAGTHYDVWYRFSALNTTHTATISGFGSNFTNRAIQIYSGTCAALVSVACGTTSVTATGLTIGNTYYIRVSNINASISSGGAFNICVTHPPPAPANDDCSGATVLTSSAACSPVTGNLRYATSNGPAGSCGAGVNASNTFDVWYSFQATATVQTVTVNSLGGNLTAASTFMQVMSGACGGLVSLGCQAVSTPRLTVTGLTIGNFYYVRVYVLLSPTASATADWNFNICVQQPPVNDECTGAITLTPGASCSNISGTLDLATVNGATPIGCFAAGNYFDVWYTFTATSVTHTVALSSLGSSFTAPRLQIYRAACGGLISMSCASATSITQAGLTIGTSYYIRVANFNVNPSGLGTVANFNICVTAVATAPSNDLCANAEVLTTSTTCNNISGTLLNATATAGLPACGNASSPEVWYSFIAESNYPVITLSNIGANLATANPRIQLFSGACGSLVQLTGACVASPLNTAGTPGGSGLTVGQTYLVRITTTALAAPVSSGTYGFNICITNPVAAAVVYGKSYINITDGTVGGTIDPGDTLEIRATLVISRAGAPLALRALDSLAYYDTLFANQGLAYVPGSMALRSNEGKLFKPTNASYYTDAYDVTDPAYLTYGGVGSDTAIRINMGIGASYAARGKMRSNSKPSNFGNTCIVMATYRVTVNAAYGQAVRFGGGAFRYRDTVSGVFYTINFPDDSLMVFQSPGACPDAVSLTNVIGDEVGGTFGAPTGPPTHLQSRGTSPNTDYAYAAFSSGSPQDYYYSIANNTSAAGTTVQTVPKTNAARVFNHWDISGDHTGAQDISPSLSRGNLPCDLSAAISSTNPCGYMLVINSAYRTDVAFEFTVAGACTETYYEISAWFKNICYKCGCDSNGVSSSNAGYVPTAPGDSSGVRPNIAFQINGMDYYTTGDLVYQGLGGTQTGSDTLNRWVKRSFVYRTKPNESSFLMTFRNNAPGGGGNDWAIDDISIKTCYPTMTYSPSANPSVCSGTTIVITDTVRSYYNVYIHYKWQRSTDGGFTWIDIPGSSGVGTTAWNGSTYEYITAYVVPQSATTPVNNGDMYQMVVATTAANLAGTCNYSDPTVLTLSVMNGCLDIDDDNDGIPDYVEFDNPVALQDANSNGIPNWNDPTYPGFVDNNTDGVNDNFDAAADSDNDGNPNYLDTDFPGYVDTNSDGVNDNADKDLDGIPNQYDLDSDNDGIPDVVESYGVDTNGEGLLDNFTDTDGDGLSQNVDANNTGVAGSGLGLGAMDFDNDGIPNYLDTDSDNDGIPDLVEAGGSDPANTGRVNSYVDADYNGISDNAVNGSALLLTGVDVSPIDGRADNYPNKNFDNDLRPNAYDLDADGDGIADVIESGLPDADLNGIIDGSLGSDGWSTTASAMGSLNLRNTDAFGEPDFLDIDSDDDGIPDNIEGQSTAGYIRPTSAADTDGDGIVNHYDNSPATFGGSGIFVYDFDVDGIPDYRDSDTDGDGATDIVEGNDFNLNGFADDIVTLTGLDTDGDGLDNRFDSLTSVTNRKGTSYMMGNGGSLIGDPAPGTRSPVQRTLAGQPDRDWRYVGIVLPVNILSFKAVLQRAQVPLNWTIISAQDIDHFEVTRSFDNSHYVTIGTISDTVQLNEAQSFGYTDDISRINNEIIYYRLAVITRSGETRYSNVEIIRQKKASTTVTIMPNPASSNVTVNLVLEKSTPATIVLVDKIGKRVFSRQENLIQGYNNIYINVDSFAEGVYGVIIETSTEKIIRQLLIIR